MTELTKQDQNKDSTLANLLKEVDRRKSAYSSGVWVPSLKADVRFCEMNTSQQKRLVKAVLDSSVYNTEFILTMRDIIKENCQDSGLDIETLTIVDKLFIGMGMRINSIGEHFPIQITTKTNEKVTVNLNLSRIVTSMKENLPEIKEAVVGDKVFVVTCGLPTIGDEVKIEREIRSKNNVPLEEIKSQDQYNTIVSDAFIEEVTKFIKDVKIMNELNEISDIGWSGYSYADRLKIVEKFSSKLLQQIVNYYNTATDIVNKVQVVNFKFGEETFERKLDIGDGDFFTVS